MVDTEIVLLLVGFVTICVELPDLGLDAPPRLSDRISADFAV